MILSNGRQLGCICILAACIGIGVLAGRLLTTRQQELRSVIELLQLLYSELDYQAVILPEAMIHCGNQLGGVIGAWGVDTGRKLLTEDGVLFRTLWSDRIRILEEISLLSPQSIQELRTLGLYLTEPDKQTQLQALQKKILRLQEMEHMQHQKLSGQIRLAVSGVILAGAFLIIILY